MTETPERNPEGEALPKARRAAHQAELRRAAEADKRRALEVQAGRKQHLAENYHSPGAFILGLLVLALLVIAGWFLINRMRCDPFYANPAALRFHGSCE